MRETLSCSSALYKSLIINSIIFSLLIGRDEGERRGGGRRRIFKIEKPTEDNRKPRETKRRSGAEEEREREREREREKVKRRSRLARDEQKRERT